MPVFDEDTYAWCHSAAIADLIHAVGTADGTVADVGAAFSQATLNDNFRELSTRVNQILGVLRIANFVAGD
jgi:hypothetical protein